MLRREIGPVLGPRTGSCKHSERELSALCTRAADKHTEFRDGGRAVG